MEDLEGLPHVCLFCCRDLPPKWQEVKTLEMRTPAKRLMSMDLSNSGKNEEAFEFLCEVMEVGKRGWWKEELSFEVGGQLPLCYECQVRYQEMWQLQVQVKMLEEMIGKFAQNIRQRVKMTENPRRVEGTQLEALGLHHLRRLIINPGYKPKKAGGGGAPNANVSLTAKQVEPAIEDVVVKEEVYVSHNLEQNQELSWMDDGSGADPLLEDEREPSPDFECSRDVADTDQSENDNQKEQTSPKTRTSQYPRRITRSTRNCKPTNLAEASDEEQDRGGNADPDVRENEFPSSSDKDASIDGSDSDFEASFKRRRITRKCSTTNSTGSSTFARLRKQRLRTQALNNSLLADKDYECHICSVVSLGYKAHNEHYEKQHPTEKLYTCGYCGKWNKRHRDALNHVRTHRGEKPFKCSECPRAYASAVGLQTHTKLRHNNDLSGNKFPCPQCDKTFPFEKRLVHHLAAVHDQIPEGESEGLKAYICHICDKSLVGLGPFGQHYADVHPEEKKYTCKFCGRHFRDLRDVHYHQRKKHTGERPFPCDQCDKTYVDIRQLKMHERTAHPSNPELHKCKECGKGFPTRFALNAHSKCHTKLVVVCKICRRPFRGMQNFVMHNRRVHQGQAEHEPPLDNPSTEQLESMGLRLEDLEKARMKCHLCWEPILFGGRMKHLIKHFAECHPEHKGGPNTCKCGKRCANYTDLRKHALRHYKDKKQFQCDQCPKSYFSAHELRYHAERNHVPLELRPKKESHVCDVCGLRLSSKSTLDKHMDAHDMKDKGIRFVCEECGKSYAYERSLQLHVNTEHLNIRPHKCTQCERTFALKTELRKHERQHTGDKPYQCPHCDKYFAYSHGKRRHIEEVHGVDGSGPIHRKRTPGAKSRTRNERGGESGTDGEKPQHTSLQFPLSISGLQGFSTNYSTAQENSIAPASSSVEEMAGGNMQQVKGEEDSRL